MNKIWNCPFSHSIELDFSAHPISCDILGSPQPSAGVTSGLCSAESNTAVFTLTTKAASGQSHLETSRDLWGVKSFIPAGDPLRRGAKEFLAFSLMWEVGTGLFSKGYIYWINISKNESHLANVVLTHFSFFAFLFIPRILFQVSSSHVAAGSHTQMQKIP